VYLGGKRRYINTLPFVFLFPKQGAQQPPLFGPCLFWRNGSMDQDPIWYGDGAYGTEMVQVTPLRRTVASSP